MGLYLLWGQEEFNINNRLSELKKKYVNPEFAAMSCKTADNPSFDELVELLSTQPFVFGALLIIVNCANYFNKSKKEINLTDNQLKKLEAIFANLNENIQVVFVWK